MFWHNKSSFKDAREREWEKQVKAVLTADTHYAVQTSDARVSVLTTAIGIHEATNATLEICPPGRPPQNVEAFTMYITPKQQIWVTRVAIAGDWGVYWEQSDIHKMWYHLVSSFSRLTLVDRHDWRQLERTNERKPSRHRESKYKLEEWVGKNRDCNEKDEKQRQHGAATEKSKQYQDKKNEAN